ncbi:ABC transporter substrate-binding protein [Blastopirellula marina]|nr:extracellular solute-binding protein [Blastopirellula marina]
MFTILRSPLIFLSCVVLCVGCNGGKDSSDGKPKLQTAPLAITVVDDVDLAERIKLEISARLEETIEVENVKREIFWNQERPARDIVIYPPAMMGELIQRDWIVPVPSATLASEEVAQDDIVQAIRQKEIRWGDKTYALPLGSPVLMLMVRTDLMKQFNLEIPTTWQEYATAVETIHGSDLLKSSETLGAATIEPLEAAYLPNLFLARSAAYVKHNDNLSTYFDYTDGKARLSSPGFVRAAEELTSIAKTIPGEFSTLSPQASAQAFLAGKSVMAIGWLNSSTLVPDTVSPDIAFAPIPGSAEIYQTQGNTWVPRQGPPVSVALLSTSGMVGSVSKVSGQTVHAAEVLATLTGTELAALISPASRRTTLYRTSSLSMADAWLPKGLPGGALRQYASVSTKQLQSTETLSSLRIAQRKQYEEALSETLRKLMTSESPNAEAALKEVSEAWDAISEKKGMAQHTDAFRRSQGSGATPF